MVSSSYMKGYGLNDESEDDDQLKLSELQSPLKKD